MKSSKVKIFVLLAVFLMIGSLGSQVKIKSTSSVKSSEYSLVNNPSKDKQDFKVLVIEIDPILTSITDTDLYPNNDGHPRVTEYFNQDASQSIAEMKKDIEDTSHGYLNVQITSEYLNEFPTYTKTLDSTGRKGFDEETYIDMSRVDDQTYGDWFKLIEDERFKELDGQLIFDYNYIINKFDLINRRNNGEFDQVWIFSIDPAQTYETLMVGKNAYYVNGSPITADCEPFIIAEFAYARRDSALHGWSHSVEQIMQKVFGISYDYYKENKLDISTTEQYNNLNLYEKFFLNSFVNSGSLNGVGDVHFPFNGTYAYDYDNTTKVKTNWRSWLNYPNVDANFTDDNNDAWMNNFGNDSLDANQNKNSDRLYTRFMLSLMPHVSGYTIDGYANNWWKYIYSLDYVNKVTAEKKDISIEARNKIAVNHILNYVSGKTETIKDVSNNGNVKIGDESLVTYRNGILYARKPGQTTLTLSYDGKPVEYNLTVTNSTKVSAEDFCQPYIEYSTTEETDDPVTATLKFKYDGCFVKDSEKTTFDENGTYEFKYTDDFDEEGTITATVDWITSSGNSGDKKGNVEDDDDDDDDVAGNTDDEDGENSSTDGTKKYKNPETGTKPVITFVIFFSVIFIALFIVKKYIPNKFYKL